MAPERCGVTLCNARPPQAPSSPLPARLTTVSRLGGHAKQTAGAFESEGGWHGSVAASHTPHITCRTSVVEDMRPQVAVKHYPVDWFRPFKTKQLEKSVRRSAELTSRLAGSQWALSGDGRGWMDSGLVSRLEWLTYLFVNFSFDGPSSFLHAIRKLHGGSDYKTTVFKQRSGGTNSLKKNLKKPAGYSH